MNAATITALATGITGILGAVTALAALFRHKQQHAVYSITHLQTYHHGVPWFGEKSG